MPPPPAFFVSSIASLSHLSLLPRSLSSRSLCSFNTASFSLYTIPLCFLTMLPCYCIAPAVPSSLTKLPQYVLSLCSPTMLPHDVSSHHCLAATVCILTVNLQAEDPSSQFLVRLQQWVRPNVRSLEEYVRATVKAKQLDATEYEIEDRVSQKMRGYATSFMCDAINGALTNGCIASHLLLTHPARTCSVFD